MIISDDTRFNEPSGHSMPYSGPDESRFDQQEDQENAFEDRHYASHTDHAIVQGQSPASYS